jgi:magnesium transporter
VVTSQCIEYGPDAIADLPIEDLDRFFQQAPMEGCAVRWLNIDGLHPHVIHQVQRAYGFHSLAAEDVLHVPQRPKVEAYEDHLFIVARMFRLDGDVLESEQVSFFLKPALLVTFQERAGDVWEPIRHRLAAPHTRLRTGDASYLLYSLLDAMVDHFFPILERYGDALDELERRLLEKPTPGLLRRLHEVRRELAVLRRVLWPTRELLRSLMYDESGLISDRTKTYLRDVHEHAIQIVEIIETFRDMVAGLTDLYMSVLSIRMNEIMKVLTIISTIFIPMTFLAGVYGMNFETFPELRWTWAYPAFWGVCTVIAIGMLIFFRRKGWIGNR